MNERIKPTILVALFLFSQLLVATSNAETAAQSRIITSDKFNKLKAKVKKQGKRLKAMEEARTVSNLYGYTMPYSPDGLPINVVVLQTLNADGSGSYSVRTRYANSTREVSVDGVMTTPPLIVSYGYASYASDGSVLEVSDYIEAAIPGPEIDYSIEESSYSLPALVKTVDSDEAVEVASCDNIPGAIYNCDVIRTTGGEFEKIESVVRVISLLGPGGINGLHFNNLRKDRVTIGTTHYDEIMARGVGLVLRLEEGKPATRAIYYRIGQQTDGSLEETPFAPGGILDGLFF